MILCVNANTLKTSPEVQKDIDLEEILLKHTYYFDTAEEALKSHYVPLDFSVSVRSMYSNQVLQIDKQGQFRYYTNLTNVQEFPHRGYDLVMYLTSIGLMHSIDYKLGFDDVMMKHSQFMPIGIYNPDPSVVNPIVYSHIIMSDEGAELLKPFLKGDRNLVDISVMKTACEGNIRALLDTIIEVKEEQKDEPDDHN